MLHSQKTAGFTVLETMMAIFVVSLAIAGATMAARGGIIGGSIAKEEVQAFYLAQEAIEILANKRDANELAAYNDSPTTNWLTGIANLASDPCHPDNPSGKFCRIGVVYQTPVNCASDPGQTCKNLQQNATTHFYGYDANYSIMPASPFKREIWIEKPNNNSYEIIVNVRITWQHGSLSREFVTKGILTNWFRSLESEPEQI